MDGVYAQIYVDSDALTDRDTIMAAYTYNTAKALATNFLRVSLVADAIQTRTSFELAESYRSLAITMGSDADSAYVVLINFLGSKTVKILQIDWNNGKYITRFVSDAPYELTTYMAKFYQPRSSDFTLSALMKTEDTYSTSIGFVRSSRHNSNFYSDSWQDWTEAGGLSDAVMVLHRIEITDADVTSLFEL